ncbi:MAG: hypothetical protein SGJ02_10150 [bacterium]|nr:hypothetical protein [bacterium]
MQVKNGILKSMLLTSFILALLGLSLGCARKVPLVNPSFEVRSVEITTTSDSIKRALRARRWVLVRETPGMIVARYQRSAKVGATIQINYSKNNITIMLVESSNLLQGLDNRGNEVIHRAYSGWIANLENDIRLELSYN